MGTPEFAVPTLAELVKNNYPLCGVVTQPDRPKGRGRELSPPPVKIFALEHHLPLFQPERVGIADFLQVLQELSPEIIVTAAFGQILPKEVLHIPKLHAINVHPSLLPHYRGPAPIHRAIINGEEKTGVTILYMTEELDAGDIILQEETIIGPEETYDDLNERLAKMGASLLIKAVEAIVQGTAPRIPQNNTAATYAPKITKGETLIHWEKKVKDIINLIRGLSSQPGAHTYLRGKLLKIFSARGEETSHREKPGTVILRTGKMAVAAADGYVYPIEVQPENRKKMVSEDFLRGLRDVDRLVLG